MGDPRIRSVPGEIPDRAPISKCCLVQFRRTRSTASLEKRISQFFETSLHAFRRRMVDVKGGSMALNRATRRKMTKTKGDWDRHQIIRLTI